MPNDLILIVVTGNKLGATASRIYVHMIYYTESGSMKCARHFYPKAVDIGTTDKGFIKFIKLVLHVTI